MNSRLELHETLCEIVNITEPNGDRHVYFQPPESVKMKYPAIVYSLSNIRNEHANNNVYKQDDAYSVVVIDNDPESEIPRKVSKLSKCRFDRCYVSDNLYHDTFTIYR